MKEKGAVHENENLHATAPLGFNLICNGRLFTRREMRRYKLVFAVVVVHDSNEVEDFVGVADFIVVPGNDFYEGVRQSDTGLSVEDGREPRKSEETTASSV